MIQDGLCRYFPETGHNVCFSFLAFFEEKGGVETLGEARRVLRMSGVRSFMPVLEALGYQVEPRRPRDKSRVYRL